MKKGQILIIVLIVACVPLQQSCAQPSPCPANNEKAAKYLNEYLSSKKNIDNLRQKRKLDVDTASFKKITIIQGEENNEVCSKLLESATWVENFENYSFYETENYYFIVMYSISDNVFKREGIAIFSKEFKRLATVMDF